MRKQLRNKKAACALCKPHKRGWENRWTARERALHAAGRDEMRDASARTAPDSRRQARRG